MRARGVKPSPTPRATLDEVLITHRLSDRVVRPVSQSTEADAMIAVINRIATDADQALGEICRRAMALTGSGSAGISVVDEVTGESVMRWKATAGVVGQDTKGVLPRDHSPCGVAIDCRLPQLMNRPDRYYEQIAAAPFPVEETLIVPFFQNGQATGTLWVITHDLRKQFHAEDVRQLKLLADLIPAAMEQNTEAADNASTAEPAITLPAKAWIDAMPQIVWTARPNGKLAQLSRAWYTYTGQPVSSGTRQWEDALAVDDVPMIRSAWAGAVQSGRPFELACRLRRASDGLMRWHLLCASPSQDEHGRVNYWLGTCTDFHDRAEN